VEAGRCATQEMFLFPPYKLLRILSNFTQYIEQVDPPITKLSRPLFTLPEMALCPLFSISTGRKSCFFVVKWNKLPTEFFPRRV
jgi:hypothetical protein